MNAGFILIFFIALAVLVGAPPIAILATAVIVVGLSFLMDK